MFPSRVSRIALACLTLSGCWLSVDGADGRLAKECRRGGVSESGQDDGAGMPDAFQGDHTAGNCKLQTSRD